MLEINTIFDDLGPVKKSGDKPAPKRSITDIKQAVRDENRVNIYIDNKFFCSLDISQVVDYHLKIGKVLTEEELQDIRRASDFGKFYSRALEYVLSRPHSAKEIRDYLKKKTLNRTVRVKNRKTGEYQTKQKEGYDASLVPLVFERLEKHGYVDDERFARLWVENRNVSKGISKKKLKLELQQKGISSSIIEQVLEDNSRDEREELRKVIAKKANRYQDKQKFTQYLVRQGFNYSDVLEELLDFFSPE
ncbi:RecX family transcriptional regulator [Candidatus Saccharibacteria bacterium]|nr:RecX family transcriptional regulator [Candidatus Saccharibacteria bacterium]